MLFIHMLGRVPLTYTLSPRNGNHACALLGIFAVAAVPYSIYCKVYYMV